MDKQKTDFLSQIYSLPVSRVWRGFGAGFFIEVGKLSDDDKKGEYSLWIETNRWKLKGDGKVFDGNEEPFEAIDKETGSLLGKKVSQIDFDTQNKQVVVTFDNEASLICLPNEELFVSIVENAKTMYLNFKDDGTAFFDNGKS